MALLSRDWDGVTLFAGAERVLAAQGSMLPQTDQFCGPFAARAALHAVLEAPPSLVELALAAGTRVWPHHVTQWRPEGAPLLTEGWDAVPRADDRSASGTDAEGLVRGLVQQCGATVSVEQVRSVQWTTELAAVLTRVERSARPVGVIANVRTGPIDVCATPWDVGHFVVLVGRSADGRVAIADSYVELGQDGAPPGCRLVTVSALAQALEAPPGRSLVLVTALDARG